MLARWYMQTSKSDSLKSAEKYVDRSISCISNKTSCNVHHFRAIFPERIKTYRILKNRNECIAHKYTHTHIQYVMQSKCMCVCVCERRWIANAVSLMNVQCCFWKKLYTQLLQQCGQHNWKHEQNIYCISVRCVQMKCCFKSSKIDKNAECECEHSFICWFFYIFLNGQGSSEWRIDLAICLCCLLLAMTWNKLEKHARSQINGIKSIHNTEGGWVVWRGW